MPDLSPIECAHELIIFLLCFPSFLFMRKKRITKKVIENSIKKLEKKQTKKHSCIFRTILTLLKIVSQKNEYKRKY